MDFGQHEALQEIVGRQGYEVKPQPSSDENVKYFDVVSEGGPISPASLINSIRDAAELRNDIPHGIPRVEIMSTQPYCVTFLDLDFPM